MVQTLPLELSDKIIDCLADKKKVLARCSLVCRNWAGRSRHHLWKVIALNCNDGSTKPGRFLDLLHHAPTLGPLVLRFTISDYHEPRDGKHPRGIIFSILEALPALDTLNLESVQFNLAHAADFAFSSIETLSISRTVFDDIVHFHHFVCAFPSVSDLAIGPDVRWDECEATDVVEACAFEIARLQIGVDDADASVITWLPLLQSIDVARLCLKEMPFYFVEMPDEWEEAWDACVPQVRHLELDLRYFNGNDDAWSTGPLLFDGNEPAIDLAKATSLRDITATISAWYFSEKLSVFVHSILETCPPDMRVDSCTILIVPEYYGEGMSSDSEDENDDGDNEDLGKAWATGFDDEECPTFDDVRIPSDALTLRLVHPFKWDEHFYRGVRALWSAGIPLRLEHMTRDGVVDVVVPQEKWSLDLRAEDEH